jgi:GNAT superfamily N-acetyltransferase
MPLNDHVADWYRSACDSEIAYSVALGGEVQRYSNFIFIYNRSIPFSGDYNRALDCRVGDRASLERIVEEVECIHDELGLEPPREFGIRPPVFERELWLEFLKGRGYGLRRATFFTAAAIAEKPESRTRLYRPGVDEWRQWYDRDQRSRPYFNEVMYRHTRKSREALTTVFSPFWLVCKDRLVAHAYLANLGGFGRLFDVEVEESFRRRGHGKELLQFLRRECHRQGLEYLLTEVLALDRLRPFYESCGFREAGAYSILWRDDSAT